MPIGKDEWNKGKKNRTIEGRILSFLNQDQLYAFTADEIMAKLGDTIKKVRKGTKSKADDLVLKDYVKALENLLQEGAIESKMIETETYYRATESRTRSNAAHENKEPL
jgi:hypothetical protein